MGSIIPLTSTRIRYIKLGSGGRWAGRGLDHGETHFGYVLAMTSASGSSSL